MMNKEQMFDWLVRNKICIEYHPPMKWTNKFGEEFSSDFAMNSPTTRFAAASTLEEAIINAQEVMK